MAAVVGAIGGVVALLLLGSLAAMIRYRKQSLARLLATQKEEGVRHAIELKSSAEVNENGNDPETNFVLIFKGQHCTFKEVLDEQTLELSRYYGHNFAYHLQGGG